MPTLSDISETHYSIPAREVRQVPQNLIKNREQARALGFGVANMTVARDMALNHSSLYAADSVQSTVTTPSIPGVIQFLQNWLPGQVHIMTAARKIDELVGISTVGSFEDEQIVQEVLENTAYAIPYGDMTNLPLSDWNLTFVPRTVVRFETGMRVGILEEARASRVRVNAGESKRQSCGIGLEIARNLVGFNGYNSGNDNTYGFLNDPGLSAYITVANNGAGPPSTLWSQKTYLQIVQDLLTAFVQLRTQTKEIVDPRTTMLTLALPTNAVDYLSTVSQYGNSVREWLRENYPNVRVVSAPQLNAANGGAGVFYLYADKVTDLSTDGGDVWIQAVPAKFMVEGVQKLVKGYQEGYLNATAGCMCKRPIAVVRYTGIS